MQQPPCIFTSQCRSTKFVPVQKNYVDPRDPITPEQQQQYIQRVSRERYFPSLDERQQRDQFFYDKMLQERSASLPVYPDGTWTIDKNPYAAQRVPAQFCNATSGFDHCQGSSQPIVNTSERSFVRLPEFDGFLDVEIARRELMSTIVGEKANHRRDAWTRGASGNNSLRQMEPPFEC